MLTDDNRRRTYRGAARESKPGTRERGRAVMAAPGTAEWVAAHKGNDSPCRGAHWTMVI